MSDPPIPSRLTSCIAGLALCAVAAGVGTIARSAPMRAAFVERPLAVCAAHEPDDGAAAFNRTRLERELERLVQELRIGAFALAAAAFLHGALAERVRARVPLLAAVTCIGGLFASATVAAMQTPIAFRAIDRGLLTASRDERFALLYPEAARAAAILERSVAPDARVLVIDFADPDHVHVFGYLVFPRRIYTPKDPQMRFDADAFRALLDADPRVLPECQSRGYAAAVDLAALVRGDERGVVPIPPLAPLAEKGP